LAGTSILLSHENDICQRMLSGNLQDGFKKKEFLECKVQFETFILKGFYSFFE
jgi:hypothetical protein